MSQAQLRDLTAGAEVVGLTVDQYIRMIDEGILPEGKPIELLDGFLVRKDRSKAGEDPRTVGFDHVWAVQNLMRVLAGAAQFGCHIRLQQPIALPPDNALEPDGAITNGSQDEYRNRYPSASDLPCVIEVADSSLLHDRITKSRIYAQGGIDQYVIINLADRVVEVRQAPLAQQGRYGHEEIVPMGGVVRFSAGMKNVIAVEVARLLP